MRKGDKSVQRRALQRVADTKKGLGLNISGSMRVIVQTSGGIIETLQALSTVVA